MLDALRANAAVGLISDQRYEGGKKGGAAEAHMAADRYLVGSSLRMGPYSPQRHVSRAFLSQHALHEALGGPDRIGRDPWLARELIARGDQG
ncbi:hypothetical protein ACFQX4_20060 [Roseomonas sp. GCM10028921]